ncbi:hypothetical protein BH23GEM10_BH23GEM10_08520 [soil metagenome]
MKQIMRTTVVAVWLVAAGTGIEAAGAARATEPAPQDECVVIDGVRYCPCPEESLDECMPPECTLVNGEWYCQE